MIKNERQYLITKAQLEKFDRALAEAETRGGDALLRKLETDALRSQLEELRQQVTEYESLRSGGGGGIIQVGSFEELPAALVKARIAARLSQKELSERLNLKEQQIQRYEATNYRSASLGRLQQIAQALGVEVRASLRVVAGNTGSAA